MTSLHFKAVIQSGAGAWVDIPFDVEKKFGKKRVPIRATIDGQPYRGSLVRMSGDCHMLLILKSIRQAIGKQPGDKVSITFREDTAARKVIVPADVQKSLSSQPQAKAFFKELAYSHQREYIEWIKGARQPETRKRRMIRMLDRLGRGKKEPH
jgi:hypothetical protein